MHKHSIFITAQKAGLRFKSLLLLKCCWCYSYFLFVLFLQIFSVHDLRLILFIIRIVCVSATTLHIHLCLIVVFKIKYMSTIVLYYFALYVSHADVYTVQYNNNRWILFCERKREGERESMCVYMCWIVCAFILDQSHMTAAESRIVDSFTRLSF